MALYIRNKAHSLHSGRGTRSSFEKLRALLGSFDGESGLQNVRHLKFTNFHNHMNKTLDILSAKRFELDSLTVQTTTVGSNAAWEKFVTVHCGQMSSVHLNAVRLNVKSLSLALSLTTLTEVRLIDVGPLGRSIAWGALKELRILDIFFASKTAESMNSVFMLSKLSCLSHLTRLQLANISLDERNLEQATTASAGFNKLERISLRRSFAAQNSYTNNVLFFLLKNAVKLRSLDLQGCSTFDLADIWVTLGPLLNRPNLKELDISQCNAKYGLGDMFVECADIKPNLSKLIMRHGSTKISSKNSKCVLLNPKQSNLKGMETSHFDGFILSFVNGNMNLTALDITRTPISDRQILQIITGRNGIEGLDLTGCYSAPRGWRRLVRREEFDKLVRIVQQLQ